MNAKRNATILFCPLASTGYARSPVIITYAGDYRGNVFDTRRIEARRLTHLVYAFAKVRQTGEPGLNHGLSGGCGNRPVKVCTNSWNSAFALTYWLSQKPSGVVLMMVISFPMMFTYLRF